MQRERGQKGANARLTANDLERWVPVRKEVRTLLERAVDRHALSARALQSLRRVARTLADLGEVEVPGTSEIGQALALRLPVR